MEADQLRFGYTVTSEIQPALGPKWLPESVRVLLGNFVAPTEVKFRQEDLTLETVRERAVQARKEPSTREVVIFLAE